METKKKQIKTMVITICILFLISISIYPSTNSRYIKEGDALEYSADLYSLYAGYFENSIDIVPSLSTPTEAYFRFIFGHNKATSEVEKDSYQIVIPSGCKLDHTTTSPYSRFDGVDKFNYIPSVDYVNDYYTILGMTCNVEQIKNENEDLIVNVPIIEQVTINGVVGVPFKFIDLNLKKSYQEYIDTVNPVPSVIEIDKFDKDGKEIDIYEEFMKWIKNYAKLSIYNTDILKYTELVTKENVTETPFPLKGISSSFENDTYTFSIEENFIGYVRTHSHHSSVLGTYMYFTYQDKESDLINDTFNHYLTAYVYEGEEDPNYIKIKEYISNMTDKVGFKAILNGEVVPGFKYFEEEGKVLMYSRVLDFAGININDYTTKIEYETALLMNQKYQESLEVFNKIHDILSEEGVTYLKTYTKLRNSVLTNNDTKGYTGYNDPKISFTDYHLYYDKVKGQYIFFRVSSDVQENAETNYNLITFDTYTASESHKIVFQNKVENDKNMLVMQIRDEQAELVEETMEFLKEYFGVDIEFTTGEKDGLFIATGTIEKGIISNIVVEEPPVVEEGKIEEEKTETSNKSEENENTAEITE